MRKSTEKTFKQLENMGIQGQLIIFIKEQISVRWIKVNVRNHITEQTRRPGNSTRRVLSVILFLVAIKGIIGEVGNKVDRSLFADNLAIYSILQQ